MIARLQVNIVHEIYVYLSQAYAVNREIFTSDLFSLPLSHQWWTNLRLGSFCILCDDNLYEQT